MSNNHTGIENNSNYMQKPSICEAVVDDLFIQDTPLVEVYIAKIEDRKQTSRLIQDLNTILPLPSLMHLRRVRNNEILLSLTDKSNPIEFLKKAKFDTKGLALCAKKIKVPADIPRTRKQYENAKILWPSNYHEDKYLEKLLSGTLFDLKEQFILRKWMKVALEAATRSKVQVGAVVVDPSTNSLVAVGGDDRETNPAKHAVMVVVDLVAMTQNGGAWPKSTLDFIDSGKIKQKPFCHKKRNADGSEKPDGDYLCTGFDVYVTREPCTMCAMALVHSRVRRVFYGCSSERGALGSLIKLHTIKALNHHYEVFKGLLKNECCSLYTKNI